MGLFDHFPYTNVHELNLDWILEQFLTLKTTIEQFVSINALKYADPIQWSIINQYEKNTIVIDPVSGVAYISVQPVPAGVALTNTDYWTVVFDLGSFVVRAAKNFTSRYEADTTLTATFSSNTNDWIIWGDTLYRAATNITAGDQYVIGSNIVAFTIESIIGHIQSLSTTDKSNLVFAINEVLQTLKDTAGDLTNLTTSDKSNLVAAINEVVQTIGDLSTLDTEDKSSVVAAVNELKADQGAYGQIIQPALRNTLFYPSTENLQATCVMGSYMYLFIAKSDSTTRLERRNLSDLSLVSSIILNIAHVNDCTVYNNLLYFVDGTSVYSIAGDLTDFTTVKTINRNTIAYDSGYFYSVTGTNIYKYDTAFNLISTIPLSDSYNGIPQTIDIVDGVIRLLIYNPNYILTILKDGTIKDIYNIKSDMIGEVEAITGIYLSANLRVSNVHAITIHTYDIQYGTNQGNTKLVGSEYNDIYVDDTYTGTDCNGTAAKPWQSLEYAVAMAQLHKNIANIRVTHYEGPLTIIGGNNISIAKVNASSVLNLTQLTIRYSNSITIQGASLAASSITNYAIIISISYNVVIRSCPIDATNYSNLIACSGSKVALLANAVSNRTSQTSGFDTSEVLNSSPLGPISITGGTANFINMSTAATITVANKYERVVDINSMYISFVMDVALSGSPMTGGSDYDVDFSSAVGSYSTETPVAVDAIIYGANPDVIAKSLPNKTTLRLNATNSHSAGTLKVIITYKY